MRFRCIHMRFDIFICVFDIYIYIYIYILCVVRYILSRDGRMCKYKSHFHMGRLVNELSNDRPTNQDDRAWVRPPKHKLSNK